MLSHSFIRYFVLLFLIGLSSCQNQIKTNGDLPDLPYIKMLKTNDNTKYLYASEFISDIEYVPLETSTECLIGGVYSINISDNYIFVSAEPSCLLFSRQGKFIRHIGNKGNGPGDFLIVKNVKIDEESGMVYLLSNHKLIAYNISGEFVKSLDISEFRNVSGICIYNAFHWRSELFCAPVDLNSGKELYSFVVFTLDGDIIKLFPNYETINNKDGYWSGGYADFRNYNELICFNSTNPDTLFRLTEQLDFTPEVFVDMCEQGMTKDDFANFDIVSNKRFFEIIKFYEVGNYILFDYLLPETNSIGVNKTQHCFYNRNNNNLIFAKGDLHAKHEILIPPGIIKKASAGEKITNFVSGFINDIDGGIPFWGSRNASIQNRQQLVNISQPSFLIKMLTEEYFSEHKIKDIQAHERLKKLLDNLDEDDNPVLKIATFK